MVLIPEFMKEFATFQTERKQVKDMDSWLAFTRKWFPLDEWPQKSADLVRHEAQAKQHPVKLGGRTWCHTSWAFDLTPEARYHYFWTLANVGDPIRFPEVFSEDVARASEEGWRQECPHCELSTDEIIEAPCPNCGRELIYVSYSE